MQCPHCQHENPPQSKFCLDCHDPVAGKLVHRAPIAHEAHARRALHVAVGATNVAARFLQAANPGGGPRISTADSPASVWMIPTNEEMMMASHTLACIRP